MSKLIEIKNWDKTPKVLLHMIKTFEDYKREVSELESYIEHLESVNKDTAFLSNFLQIHTASKELLKKSKDCIELRLWSKIKIEEGDTIKLLTSLDRTLQVVSVVENRDHSGMFEKLEDAIESFYVVHAKYVREV